ncbi:OsmC family protein [Flavobacterium sp. '19STA2R22 D10 B1']|uniref:OsmC family protein n=1 Tax=Flavobacterium aerium TaxID=3037261 RepID=UPI00278C1CA9|nr:OsmC family protein [Flavobacterium sp. '19STA2R22 D10 B1']
MSTKTVNVLGYVEGNEQFVVKTQNFSVRISKNAKAPELEGPSPIEYLLSGFAGCINAVGQLVAKELAIPLKSLQVEISGELDTSKYYGKETNERAGFKKIEVVVKPTTDVSFELLQKWLALVEERCPIQDNLVNSTPIELTLVKEFPKEILDEVA